MNKRGEAEIRAIFLCPNDDIVDTESDGYNYLRVFRKRFGREKLQAAEEMLADCMRDFFSTLSDCWCKSARRC